MLVRITIRALFLGAVAVLHCTAATTSVDFGASASDRASATAESTPVHQTVSCDVVVAGGSTASLAAAITAAEADPTKIVCFTEITDWAGGQMTAGGVPAIDFGGSNKNVDNQPASFRDFFNHVQGNPGACSVSIKCYEPQWLVETWVNPRMAKSGNLKVFLRTAVVATARDASGRVTSVTAVQRTPRANVTEYSTPLSKMLPDWYAPEDSASFTKTVLQLEGRIFIEATEFGDLLATSGLPYSQGTESPVEDSFNTLSTCGQVWTLTYYMTLLAAAPASPRSVPAGSDEGIPFASPWGPSQWLHSWSWRRAKCAGNTSLLAANVGDVTQQNLLNDLDSAYLLLDTRTGTAPSRAGGDRWQGGINLTALAMLEGRAYGSYHYMLNNTPDPTWRDRLALDYVASGTDHGLSKMPYVRDTRRAIGVDRFRLMYPAFDYFNQSSPETGFHYNDTIALGNYNDDIHHLSSSVCTYPAYIANHTTKPYYVPFRALMVGDAPNLLVAGKTMSQTFHASAATRLHPSEWSTGVAAGAAAVFMLQRSLQTTSDVLDNIKSFQAYVNSSAVGQPLDWVHGVLPDPQIGFACWPAFARCIGVDRSVHNASVHNTTTCDGSCAPLSANEWLANKQFWAHSDDKITAIQATLLKKSVANSGVLPPNELKTVPAGYSCLLASSPTESLGYYLGTCK